MIEFSIFIDYPMTLAWNIACLHLCVNFSCHDSGFAIVLYLVWVCEYYLSNTCSWCLWWSVLMTLTIGLNYNFALSYSHMFVVYKSCIELCWHSMLVNLPTYSNVSSSWPVCIIKFRMSVITYFLIHGSVSSCRGLTWIHLSLIVRKLEWPICCYSQSIRIG